MFLFCPMFKTYVCLLDFLPQCSLPSPLSLTLHLNSEWTDRVSKQIWCMGVAFGDYVSTAATTDEYITQSGSLDLRHLSGHLQTCLFSRGPSAMLLCLFVQTLSSVQSPVASLQISDPKHYLSVSSGPHQPGPSAPRRPGPEQPGKPKNTYPQCVCWGGVLNSAQDLALSHLHNLGCQLHL